jgi:hypothetical protein
VVREEEANDVCDDSRGVVTDDGSSLEDREDELSCEDESLES